MILGLSIYIAGLLFIGLTAYKAATYASMPLHGRLELYSVPSEKGRHTYGGSYMEELEWWRKPREISKASEIIDMMKEMLFIKKLFDNQRPFWWMSYALHLGIYFLMGWTFLLIAGALTDLAGVPVSAHASWWTVLLYYLTIFTGIIGFIIATVGTFGLLLRRFFDPVLKIYTTPQEYFNLGLLFAALVSGIVLWSPDLTFNAARQLMADALILSVVPNMTLVIHLIILEFMFIYIPVSKMSHYVGKYFSYHKFLWDNEPNITGSHMESKVRDSLNYKPTTTWAAPHMQTTAVTKEE